MTVSSRRTALTTTDRPDDDPRSVRSGGGKPARPQREAELPAVAHGCAGLLPRDGRWTEEVTRLLLAFAQRAGREAGARLSQAAGVPTSPDTPCRLLRARQFSVGAAPDELGVDDFAFRRRQPYGLILVDLQVSRPIDVLPDVEASTLATWLREHPRAKIVARDRGPPIREGVALELLLDEAPYPRASSFGGRRIRSHCQG